MSLYRITSRYAKALLDLGVENNDLESVHKDVQLLVNTFEDNRDLILLFKNPIILPQKKMAVIEHVFKGRVGDVSFKFMEVIVRKNRSVYIYETLKQFLENYKAYKHIADATLRTAVDASNSTKKTVEKLLEDASNEKIILHTEVDEDLIGGFQIRYKDQLIDASVASKLNNLKQEILD